MNNLDWIIEGTQRHCNSETYAMVSDLSPFPLSERFDARLHGAGINDEENAGQRDNTARTTFSCHNDGEGYWRDGRGMSLLDSRKPHAVKGMHTRSQQIFSVSYCSDKGNAAVREATGHIIPLLRNRIKAEPSFLAGAGWVVDSDAHARDAAVAQRLHSDLFGGGETRHANAETSLTFGEISEVRQPASFPL